MFRHRCDNRNVVLSIGWIQERIKSSCPWSDFAREGQNGKADTDDTGHGDGQGLEQDIEVFFGHIGSQIVDESDDLT